jgi:hypothetical protein
MWLNFAAVAAFGLALEVIEELYYHQPLEIRDVFLDWYGAVIGLLAYLGVRRWTRRHAVSSPHLPPS